MCGVNALEKPPIEAGHVLHEHCDAGRVEPRGVRDEKSAEARAGVFEEGYVACGAD